MTKGSFILDMNSITNSDLQDADMKSKLVGHLKSPDFFDVAKFPTATFVVTRVARLKAAQNATGEIKATHLVEGNLTMKGITQQVKLNATISIMNGKLTAASLPFKVDRTKWGVNYQSKSIFSELKDKFIYDEITLKIDLLAK
jgi:polyisoprenoid-binding protein YceI